MSPPSMPGKNGTPYSPSNPVDITPGRTLVGGLVLDGTTNEYVLRTEGDPAPGSGLSLLSELVDPFKTAHDSMQKLSSRKRDMVKKVFTAKRSSPPEIVEHLAAIVKEFSLLPLQAEFQHLDADRLAKTHAFVSNTASTRHSTLTMISLSNIS